MSYKNPDIEAILFSFDTDYNKPSLSNVNFYGWGKETTDKDLSYYINALPFYINNAYTSLKTCNNKVVLFDNSFKIIKGKCEYTGIRDLLFGINEVVHTNNGYSDMLFSLNITKLFSSEESLSMNIDLHNPTDLNSSINSHNYNSFLYFIKSNKTSYSDINCFIDAVKKKDESPLYGNINNHQPENIRYNLKGYKNDSSYINSSIHGLTFGVINHSISAHVPYDMVYSIRLWYSVGMNINYNIHGYDVKDLTYNIKQHLYSGVNYSIDTHQYSSIRYNLKTWLKNSDVYLYSYVRGWGTDILDIKLNSHLPSYIYYNLKSIIHDSTELLPVYIRGWQDSYLSLSLGSHLYSDKRYIIKGLSYNNTLQLPVYIRGWQEDQLSYYIYTNEAPEVKFLIKGWSLNNYTNITNSLMGWVTDDLNYKIKQHNPSDINLSVLSHKPSAIYESIKGMVINDSRSVGGYIYGWATSGLGSTVSSHTYDNMYYNIKVYSNTESRLLSNYIRGWETVTLTSNIKAHSYIDFSNYIFTKQFTSTTIKNYIYGWADSGINISVSGHNYDYIYHNIKVYDKSYSYIYNYIYGWSSSDILFDISSNRSYKSSYSLLTKFINGIRRTEDVDLNYSIDTHQYGDLSYLLVVKERHLSYLNQSLFGYAINDINYYLTGVLKHDLNFYLNTIPYETITFDIKKRPESYINYSIFSFGYSCLYFNTKCIYDSYLSFDITEHSYKDILFKIKPYSSRTESNLNFSISFYLYSDLNMYLKPYYTYDLNYYLYAVKYETIDYSIYGYAYSDIYFYVQSVEYKDDLKMSIMPNTNYLDMNYCIKSVFGKDYNTILKFTTTGVVYNNLNMHVNSIIPVDLNMDITIDYELSDLRFYLKPDSIVIYDTIYVYTMDTSCLNFDLNTSCGGSDYSTLRFNIKTSYFDDISYSLIPYKRPEYNKDLFFSVGYENSYNIVDKLNLTINLNSSDLYTINRLGIFVNMFSSSDYLSYYIKPVMQNSALTYNIRSVYIDNYSFDETKNRQKVGNINDSMQKSVYYKIVEFSFSDTIKEYLYSIENKDVYKADILDRWILNVKAFMPENKRIGTKRRVLKDVDVDSLKGFSNIDEMIKHCIYITTAGASYDLVFGINGENKKSDMYFNIKSESNREVKCDFTYSINPVKNKIFVDSTGKMIIIR